MLIKIMDVLSTVYASLRKDITENRQFVATYAVILLLTGTIYRVATYVADIVSGQINNPLLLITKNFYQTRLIDSVIFQMAFISIACLFRRFWPCYGLWYIVQILGAIVIVTISGILYPTNFAWVPLFRTMMSYMPRAIIDSSVTALVFFGLCSISGLPRPQSRGWKARLKELAS
ncbi:MAG: hypothetical protein ACYC1M_06030 [Armatimonadota bacterium]